MRAALALCLTLTPAWAEVPLSAAEFEARTAGRTLTYAQDGRISGREQYLAGRRVIWAFTGEECKYGVWDEPVPGLICFAYEDAPEQQECWRFYDRAGGLVAQSELAPEGVLAVMEQSDTGMICGGLGV
ncbi:MAG: hypothetical protein E6Q73_00190 [Pseudorhodobacter sp.]|nr:MAG: hypothetical protein E6Q73_00190 [Pseudorhodobacter sp.]